MSRTLRLSLVLMLLAAGLAACGKRGQLDPPGGQKQAEAAPAQTGEAASGQTRLGGKKRIPITAPKRDLPIDFILE
jgi:predicted small lipoprotein YifL